MVYGRYDRFESRMKTMGKLVGSIPGRILLCTIALLILMSCIGIIYFYASRPDDLTITVPDTTYYYGTDPFTQEIVPDVTGLNKGHVIQDISWEYSELDRKGDYIVSVGKYKIVNKKGEDVSHKYLLQCISGSLRGQQTVIEITTASGEKTYDGKAFSLPEWTITKGNLLPEHYLEVTISTSPYQYGTYRNDVNKYIVKNAAGENVTQCYDIRIKYGTITIHPIVLSFVSGSSSKVFDDIVLVNNECTHISGNVAEGHRLEYYAKGNRRYVGESKNLITAVVYDENNNDVTNDGYIINQQPGTIIIEPRPISDLRSESAQKIYDGTALRHMVASFDKSDLVNGHRSKYVFTGSQTNVGSSPNTFTLCIYDVDGTDITKNYIFDYEYGTLTVLPNDQEENNNQGDSSHGGGGNQSGSSQGGNTSGNNGDNQFPLDTQVKFPDNTDITPLYRIGFYDEYNKFRRVYLRALSYGDYTYKGWKQAKEFNSYFDTNPLLFTGMALGAQDKLIGTEYSQSILYIDKINSAPDVLTYYIDTFYELNVSGNDVKVSFEDEEYKLPLYFDVPLDVLLEIKGPEELSKAEMEYRDFVYDTYLYVPLSTKKDMLRIGEENGISVNSRNLITDIQQYILGAAAYNMNAPEYPDGVDVAVYFLETAKEGICQHFATAATLMYRAYGIPARYTVGYASVIAPGSQNVVTSQDGHAWVEIYLDGVGWVPMEVTGSMPPSVNGKDKIVVSGVQLEKIYDGKPMEKWEGEFFYISQGTLKEGHTIHIDYELNDFFITYPHGYIVNVNKVTILDKDGNDVTLQYDITYEYGSVNILKRPITIHTGSCSKHYDGSAAYNNEWWIASGTLLSGHTIYIDIDMSITKIGSVPNVVSSFYILDENGKNVTDYYDVSFVYGTLEVSK